jgi:hypothetical protein
MKNKHISISIYWQLIIIKTLYANSKQIWAIELMFGLEAWLDFLKGEWDLGVFLHLLLVELE